MADAARLLFDPLHERFGERFTLDHDLPGLDGLVGVAARRVHRRYLERAVAPDLVRLLCACALSAPLRRAETCPYRNPRDVARFGEAEFYGWSEDKARQYAVPLRADFGAFVRAQGFSLD